MTEADSEPNEAAIVQYRRFYAEEIRAVADLDSNGLVSAFASVPREKFLGPGPWKIAGESFLGQSGYRTAADPRDLYHNVVVALKSEQSLNNGQPSALASWIAALNLGPGVRVFHVGCGTGYYTAIMAEVVGPGGAILAVEADPDLAALATENLRDYGHVTVVSGDGASVDPGLCDAILINAGVTHPHIPWLQGLKEDGRIVLPLTVHMKPGIGRGIMIRITREHDRFPAEIVSMVGIYSSISVRDTAIETMLLKTFESRELLKLKCIRLDAHEPANSCIVHTASICLSNAPIERTEN